MNNHSKLIILLALLSLPLAASAQTDDKQSPEVGARLSFALDKKIVKGLHISLDEQLRFDNNFKSFDRFHTTVAVKYKVHENVKLGLGYAMINSYSSSSASFKNMRHRIMADVTGTLKLGKWNLSLKERFQATFRTGDYNVYQNPACALTLKSRLMLKYKGFQKVEPYTYFEVRNYLNAPVISAAYDGSTYYTLEGEESGDAGVLLVHGSYPGSKKEFFLRIAALDVRQSEKQDQTAYASTVITLADVEQELAGGNGTFAVRYQADGSEVSVQFSGDGDAREIWEMFDSILQ